MCQFCHQFSFFCIVQSALFYLALTDDMIREIIKYIKEERFFNEKYKIISNEFVFNKLLYRKKSSYSFLNQLISDQIQLQMSLVN